MKVLPGRTAPTAGDTPVSGIKTTPSSAPSPSAPRPLQLAPVQASGGRLPGAGTISAGFGAGALVQHQLAGLGGRLSIDDALARSFELLRRLSNENASPASYDAAARTSVDICEAKLQSQGVRTSRTAEGTLKIEPDSRTPWGRYAMATQKWTRASVIYDPNHFRSTAAASYSRKERAIRINPDDLEAGGPDDTELHELIHALFHSVTDAGREHPLDGWNYAGKHETPVLGYERGYAREEMATFGFQAYFRQRPILEQVQAVIKDGSRKLGVHQLMDQWDHEPASAYCEHIASHAWCRADDALNLVNKSGNVEVTTGKDSWLISLNSGLDVLVTAQHAEGGRKIMQLTVCDRVHDERVQVMDADPALVASMTGTSKTAFVETLRRHVASRLEQVKTVAMGYYDVTKRLGEIRHEIRSVLERSPTERMTGSEATEVNTRLNRYNAVLEQLRDRTGLLPKDFAVLEADTRAHVKALQQA